MLNDRLWWDSIVFQTFCCALNCLNEKLSSRRAINSLSFLSLFLSVSLSPPTPPSSLTHRKQDGRIPRISDEVEPSRAHSHPPFPLPILSKVTQDFDLLWLSSLFRVQLLESDTEPSAETLIWLLTCLKSKEWHLKQKTKKKKRFFPQLIIFTADILTWPHSKSTCIIQDSFCFVHTGKTEISFALCASNGDDGELPLLDLRCCPTSNPPAKMKVSK